MMDRVFAPEHRVQTVRAHLSSESAGTALCSDRKTCARPYIYVVGTCFAAGSLMLADRRIRLRTPSMHGRVRASTRTNVSQGALAGMRLAGPALQAKVRLMSAAFPTTISRDCPAA